MWVYVHECVCVGVGALVCACGIVVYHCVVLCESEVRWGVVMGGVVVWSCHTALWSVIMCYGGDSELTY